MRRLATVVAILLQPLVALAVAIKHPLTPVCDLEAEGCVVSVGGLHGQRDCRTCAAHMELCMATPRVDADMQVRQIKGGACVEQIANKAKGCSACKTPEGKKMFKARLDAAKAAAVQSIETAASEKIDSTVCDLEAEGCVKNGDLKDCRTCAGHMELCMVTPHLDEEMQVPCRYE